MATRVLDLFCGAGGCSDGFTRAGAEVIAGVDADEAAVETFAANHDATALQRDLTAETPAAFDETTSIDTDGVDIVVGGPPCQGFSMAAKSRDVDDERNNLVFVFADHVDHLDPEHVLMENVTGLARGEMQDIFDRLLDEFEAMGYTVESRVLNAAEYGVPQRRNRLFIQGTRDGTPSWPDPTHGSSRRPMLTVEGAFSGLPSLDARESSTITNHTAPRHQDSTVERIASTDHGEPLYDSWTEKIRLNPMEPAPTLKAGKRANFHFGHPFDARGLTVRERARLQSFHDDFVFEGGVVDGRTLTGNAVPPRLAEHVAQAMLSA
jgi:DNA (cytosine-5)-methyltransferase 1